MAHWGWTVAAAAPAVVFGLLVLASFVDHATDPCHRWAGEEAPQAVSPSEPCSSASFSSNTYQQELATIGPPVAAFFGGAALAIVGTWKRVRWLPMLGGLVTAAMSFQLMSMLFVLPLVSAIAYVLIGAMMRPTTAAGGPGGPPPTPPPLQ